MVKQGRYAKSSKMKQIKAIRKRMHAPAGRVIQPDAFDQFVLVRYGLTLKKRLKGIGKQTVQRFLQEMLVVTSVDEAWSLETILVKTFKNINIKVPFHHRTANPRAIHSAVQPQHLVQCSHKGSFTKMVKSGPITPAQDLPTEQPIMVVTMLMATSL